MPEGTMLIWHQDVRVYRVWDGKEQGGDFLGYLYCYPHPRELKRPVSGYWRSCGASLYFDLSLTRC